MAAHGLGRGFETLIPTDLVDEEFDPTSSEDAKASKLVELPLAEIEPDREQPRKGFTEEAMKQLATSISQHGVLQPIVVVKEGKKYKIVAGERRYRAAKMVGLSTIPAIVRTLDAQNRLELSIIENAQREDLNPIELATAYAKLKAQFNLSDQEIADRLGKGKATIVNTMRLLHLPEAAKKAMLEYNIREGVMRPLISADPEIVAAAIPRLIKEDWTARQTEQFVKSYKKKSSVAAVKARHYMQEEKRLTEKYKAKVKIGTKTITFSVKNEEQLKEILRNF